MITKSIRRNSGSHYIGARACVRTAHRGPLWRKRESKSVGANRKRTGIVSRYSRLPEFNQRAYESGNSSNNERSKTHARLYYEEHRSCLLLFSKYLSELTRTLDNVPTVQNSLLMLNVVSKTRNENEK